MCSNVGTTSDRVIRVSLSSWQRTSCSLSDGRRYTVRIGCLAAPQLLDPVDIAHGDLGARVGPVARRECLPVACVQLGRALLSVRGDQRGAQLIGPGPGGLGDPRLNRRDVVVVRDAAGGVDDVVDADDQRLRQLQPPVDVVASERVGQDPPRAQAVLGIEAVTRQAQRAGDEPIELVTGDEQAHALALAQAQDADRYLEQILGVDLDHQVPGQGLEDVDQALGVVAVRRERSMRQHPLHLVSQQRYLSRAGLVGGGGVEAEEAALADHPSIGSKPLDADVVQVRRAMNGGA